MRSSSGGIIEGGNTKSGSMKSLFHSLEDISLDDVMARKRIRSYIGVA